MKRIGRALWWAITVAVLTLMSVACIVVLLEVVAEATK